MNPSSLRYRLAPNFLFSKVKLVIDQQSVQANVAPHPLFSQVKEIHLINDQLNLKCLQLIQNSQISITSDKSHDFVQRCKDVFGIHPQLIIEEASINLLLSKNEQDFQTLDYLNLNDLLSVIKTAFDKTGVKLHSKIMRKLKNYSTNSKRKQPQKEIIDSIIKSYQETEVKQEVQVVNNDEPQANVVIIKQKQKKNQSYGREKKQYTNQAQTQQKYEQRPTKNRSHTGKADKINTKEQQNDIQAQEGDKFQVGNNKKYGKNRRNRRREQNQLNDQENKNWKRGSQRRKSNNQTGDDRGNSRGKNDNVDPKFLLGINGDTQFGWRQRHRPSRVPPKNLLDPIEQQQHTLKSYKTENKKRQLYGPSSVQAQKVVQEVQKEYNEEIVNKKQQIQQSKALKKLQDGSKLIFSYPQDGKSYNFNQIKNGFKAFVNNSFWVSFKEGVLKIQKGQNGYVRDSFLDPFKNKIMAEGLTLNLEGSSNLQDGGEVLGNPSIQQFTGNNSQFFHIKTLDIYSESSLEKSSKKQNIQTEKNEEKEKSKKQNRNEVKKQKKQVKKQKDQKQQKGQKGQKGQEQDNDWQDQEQAGQIQ